MQSQGSWIQCLLTQLPIACLHYRSFPFGMLPTVAFESFCHSSKLTLFIVQRTTSAPHLPVPPTNSYSYPGSDHGNGRAHISCQGRNQACFLIHVLLKKPFGNG